MKLIYFLSFLFIFFLLYTKEGLSQDRFSKVICLQYLQDENNVPSKKPDTLRVNEFQNGKLVKTKIRSEPDFTGYYTETTFLFNKTSKIKKQQTITYKSEGRKTIFMAENLMDTTSFLATRKKIIIPADKPLIAPTLKRDSLGRIISAVYDSPYEYLTVSYYNDSVIVHKSFNRATDKLVYVDSMIFNASKTLLLYRVFINLQAPSIMISNDTYTNKGELMFSKHWNIPKVSGSESEELYKLPDIEKLNKILQVASNASDPETLEIKIISYYADGRAKAGIKRVQNDYGIKNYILKFIYIK